MGLHGIICCLKCSKVLRYLAQQSLTSWAPTKRIEDRQFPHVHGHIAITKRLPFEFAGRDGFDVFGLMNSLRSLKFYIFFKVSQNSWHVDKVSASNTVESSADIETATMRTFYWVMKIPFAIHKDQSGRINIDVMVLFTIARMDLFPCRASGLP